MGILIFILILGFLVLIHEAGHFFMARFFKVRVEEFGIGFPPRLWAKKRGDITYSINALPLGGFVKIYGENGEDKGNADSFGAKPIWQRALILSAGVFNNFIFCFLILVLLFSLGMPSLITPANQKYVVQKEVRVIDVSKNSPASLIQLSTGDKIVAIKYQGEIFENMSISQFQEKIKSFAGNEILLVVEKQGKILDLAVTPRVTYPAEEGSLGISLMEAGIVAFPVYQSFWEAGSTMFTGAYQIVKAIGQNVKALFVKTEAPDLSGPVGIAMISSKTYHLGWRYIGSFLAVLSLNLAVLNFLPFPALDGGRLFFLLIEKIRRKPVSQKIEAMANTVGFAFLMFLVLLITIKDIRNLI